MRYLLAVLLFASCAIAQDDTSSSALPQSDRPALQHRLKLSNTDSLKISSIDLNDDDVPEIFAQATDSHNCGASGNCTFWILQKKGTDYKILLKSIAQNYRIRTIKTGGFADVELGLHDSAYRTEWRGYKYDGRHYVKVKCWANVTGDGEHKYPEPKVEPCKKR